MKRRQVCACAAAGLLVAHGLVGCFAERAGPLRQLRQVWQVQKCAAGRFKNVQLAGADEPASLGCMPVPVVVAPMLLDAPQNVCTPQLPLQADGGGSRCQHRISPLLLPSPMDGVQVGTRSARAIGTFALRCACRSKKATASPSDTQSSRQLLAQICGGRRAGTPTLLAQMPVHQMRAFLLRWPAIAPLRRWGA